MVVKSRPETFVEEIPGRAQPTLRASRIPLDRIRVFNDERDPERLKLKYKAMAKNALAFFRGTCHLFWEEWQGTGVTVQAPLVWACGDLHFENFGAFKGGNRLDYFDINDFDESALAPCTRDPVRFLCSLLLASRDEDLGSRLCERFLTAFVAALGDGTVGWIERETARGDVGQLLRRAEHRKRVQLLDDRTWKAKRQRCIRIKKKRALTASPEQKACATDLVERATAQGEEQFLQVLDVARRVAGTGSLGLERYVVLVEGKGSPDRNYLLDVKVARPSAMRATLKVKQPAWASEAERVVWVQRHMQAAAPALLRAVVGQAERSYVIRELQPREDRLDLREMRRTPDSLEATVHTMGRLLAWAQLRASGRRGAASADALLDYANDPRWRAPLVEYAVTYASKTRVDFEAFRAAWRDDFFDAQCGQ